MFVDEAMTGELIGIGPVGEADWHVHVGSMRLGVLHEASGLVLPLAEDAAR